jgi:hypothetical protein
MAITTSNDTFESAILRAIGEQIQKVAEEEAQAAAERVKQRVKEQVASIAVAVADHYSVERMGRDLVIRVRHEGPIR